jgi:hypothetical protein
MTHFKNNFLRYVLLALSVIVIALSFQRFVLSGDYIVEYEGACDPATESCFLACETEDCADTYYHSWVRKHHNDVFAACGPDVSECDAASVCQPTDTQCTIVYCDASVDECVGPGFVAEESEETEEATEEVPEEESAML